MEDMLGFVVNTVSTRVNFSDLLALRDLHHKHALIRTRPLRIFRQAAMKGMKSWVHQIRSWRYTVWVRE